MRRIWTVLPLLTLTAGGCAVFSGNESSTPAATARQYEAMESMPPEAQKEDAPKLEEKQVWVPGYYEPVSGTWIWRAGTVTAEKEGYRIVPASYKEDGGKVYFTPPRWRRADVGVATAKK
jgi:hypothetical protein